MTVQHVIERVKQQNSLVNSLEQDEKIIILGALEKQIPKKPIEVEEREEADFYYLAFVCPCCNEAVIGQPYRPNNCKHCGQKLDWSEWYGEINKKK